MKQQTAGRIFIRIATSSFVRNFVKVKTSRLSFCANRANTGFRLRGSATAKVDFSSVSGEASSSAQLIALNRDLYSASGE